ncbi:MAG: nuclear transport factor 2 family protein [Acidobacteria bacterium]|nr:nuclear transport factor 2 family protein [Acidobacteriota bacterium]
MKNFIVLVTIGLLGSLGAFAQKSDDSKDALAVVNKMFDEMANHDPAAIAGLWTKDSNLAAVVTRRDGKKQYVSFSGEVFSKNFAEKKGEIKEEMYAPKVEVDGDIALVYGRYVFFTDGKLSHCGLNAFQLIRTDGVWKIANAVSSMEPNGCTKKEKSIKPPTVQAPK